VKLSVILSAATLDSAVRNRGGRRSNEPSPLWSLPLAQANAGPTAVLVEELDARGLPSAATEGRLSGLIVGGHSGCGIIDSSNENGFVS
jgi:hypothetical protein